MGRIITVFAERGLVRHSDGSTRLVAPEPYTQEFAELHLIGETLRPTLGRHFLALSLLQERGAGMMSRRQLEDDCHLLAQRLSLLGGFSAAEITDRSVFSMLVGNLLIRSCCQKTRSGMLQFDQQLIEPLAYAELVLPAEVRQAVRRVAAMSPAVAGSAA